MDIKVLKVNNTTESTTLRFTDAMQIGALLSGISGEASRHYEDSKAR